MKKGAEQFVKNTELYIQQIFKFSVARAQQSICQTHTILNGK